MNYLIIGILLSFSALFSGLNLGLLSLGVTDLERKAALGDIRAQKILPIRRRGNLLLCTLLLGNVLVNSTLAIFMADISTGLIGGFLSTSFIVLFGEIFPQSAVSRHALEVGARTAFIMRLLLLVFYPLAAPLAWMLDKILGDELPTVWSKEEIKEIIKDHEDSPHSTIDEDEERIIIGALSFSHKIVRDVMTPSTVVFGLNMDDILDTHKVNEIKQARFTRIPIFDQENDDVIGILFTKDLIGIEEDQPVAKLYKKDKFLKVSLEKPLDELLNLFIKRRIHLACVYDDFGLFQGIVTLEDVIEEIIQREVFDEGEKIKDPRTEAMKKVELELAE